MSDDRDARLDEAAKVFAENLEQPPAEDQADETQNDQQPPSPEGQGDTEQPTRDAPTEDTQEPEFLSDNFDPSSLPDDLKPAYNQLRADYTRKRQAEAPYRRFFEERGLDPSDPQAAFSALAHELGYELEDTDTPDDEPDLFDEDEDSEPDPGTLAWQYIQEQQTQQAQLQSLGEDLSKVQERLGRDLTDEEVTWLGQRASFDGDGRLGLFGSVEILDWMVDNKAKADTQKWAKSKEAPAVQAGGTRASQTVDLDDPEQRRAYTAQLLQEQIGQS